MPYHTILLLGYFKLKINSTFNVTSSLLKAIEQSGPVRAGSGGEEMGAGKSEIPLQRQLLTPAMCEIGCALRGDC